MSYAEIGAENLALLRFFVEAYQDVSPDSVLLDFGGGPTIYALIAAAPRVREIHVCDYLTANLDEVRQWLHREPEAFDWRPFVRTTLELEHGKPCRNADVAHREREIRARVHRLMTCDLNLARPLSAPSRTYDIVTTNFCAESITDQRGLWAIYLRRVASLARPGGKIVLSALKGAVGYRVGAQLFPAVNLAEPDLASALAGVGCDRGSILIKSVAADHPARGYDGLMFATARKHAGCSQSPLGTRCGTSRLSKGEGVEQRVGERASC